MFANGYISTIEPTPYVPAVASSDDLAEIREDYLAQIAQQAISRFDAENGIVDGFVDTSGINTGSSTGYSQSSGVVANTSTGGSQSIDITGGTFSSSDTTYGDPTYMNDGTTNASNTNIWQCTTSGSAVLDMGSGNGFAVESYTFYPRNDTVSYCPTDWVFYGSNTGAFSGEETTLDTQSSVSGWSTGTAKTFSVTNSTSYRYHKWTFDASSATYAQIVEIEMAETTAVTQNAMSVLSTTATLSSAPTNGYGYILIKDTGNGDTLVVTDSTESNNNLRLYITADGGATWTWLALSSLGVVSGSVYAYESALTAISSPSTTLGYKWTTHDIDSSPPSVEVGGINILVD